MFNADPMLRSLQRVSTNFPKYTLTASLSPLKSLHMQSSSPLPRKSPNQKNRKNQVILKSTDSKLTKPKKPIKPRARARHKYLDLIQRISKKIKICDPSELKLDTSKKVYSRPATSRVQSSCLSSKHNYKSKFIEINLPKFQLIKD